MPLFWHLSDKLSSSNDRYPFILVHLISHVLLGVLSEPNISLFNFEAADSDIGEATPEFSITDNNEDASMDIRIDPEELVELALDINV